MLFHVMKLARLWGGTMSLDSSFYDKVYEKTKNIMDLSLVIFNPQGKQVAERRYLSCFGPSLEWLYTRLTYKDQDHILVVPPSTFRNNLSAYDMERDFFREGAPYIDLVRLIYEDAHKEHLTWDEFIKKTSENGLMIRVGLFAEWSTVSFMSLLMSFRDSPLYVRAVSVDGDANYQDLFRGIIKDVGYSGAQFLMNLFPRTSSLLPATICNSSFIGGEFPVEHQIPPTYSKEHPIYLDHKRLWDKDWEGDDDDDDYESHEHSMSPSSWFLKSCKEASWWDNGLFVVYHAIQGFYSKNGFDQRRKFLEQLKATGTFPPDPTQPVRGLLPDRSGIARFTIAQRSDYESRRFEAIKQHLPEIITAMKG